MESMNPRPAPFPWGCLLAVLLLLLSALAFVPPFPGPVNLVIFAQDEEEAAAYLKNPKAPWLVYRQNKLVGGTCVCCGSNRRISLVRRLITPNY